MARVFRKGALQGFLFFILTSLLAGCASFDKSELRQPVLVLSDPPGAKVFSDSELLGETPGYLRIPREKNPSMRLVFPNGEKREVDLRTKYRWAGSFAANLWFYVFAPIGWTYDLIKGTAWNIQEPEVIRQPGSHDWPQILPPKVIAVAPPVVEERDKINTLGLAIQERLQETEQFKVLSYNNTVDNFRYNRSYQGLSDNEPDRLRLYSTIHADHILESRATQRGGTYIVQAELRDIVTGRVDRKYVWEMAPPKDPLDEKPFLERFAKKSFHLIPNTIFVNFTSYNPTVTINNIEYAGKESPKNSTLEKVLDKITAISIARLDRTSYDIKGHWVFDFVPMIVLSKKTIQFPKNVPLIGSEFERVMVSGGYGIETGYIGRYGFVYLDLIPSLTYAYVKYESPIENGTVSSTKVLVNTELGYSYFFSNHLVARLFVRTLAEDKEVWSQALTGVSGTPTRTDSMNSSFGGLSLGYYFDSQSKRSGWRVK